MFKHLIAGVGFALAIGAAHADDAIDKATDKAVRDAVAALVPNAQVEAIEKSDVAGLYEVIVGGQVLYVSADGKYLIQGDVIDVANKARVASRAQAKLRLDELKKLPLDKQIVFAPPNPKRTVTVFTDPDCPYCKQFHKQIAAYNQIGIAVHYVFFPLTSIHPGAQKKALAVWCAQDRNAAYTAAMNGQDPGTRTCANPLAELTALANKIGINATPTILDENGMQVNGNMAQDPKQLLGELDRMAAQEGKAAAPAKAG